MVAETALMPRGKKKQPGGEKPPVNTEKYRKGHKAVRIRLRLAEAGTTAADALEQDLTQYVNDALRMRLEAEGKWPPKAPPSPPSG